jgi:uncharacterized membrane protein SirB2
LIDLCWQATWDAMFFYLMLRAVPYIDGAARSRWSNTRCLAVFAPLNAVAVIASGCLLLIPLTVVTFLGGPQWPVVVALVLGYLAVAAVALQAAKPPKSRVEPVTAWSVGVYAMAFAAMIVANLVHERGLVLYAAVQAVGLAAICALALFPALGRGRQMAIHTSAVVLSAPFSGAAVGEDHSPRRPEKQRTQ